MRTILNFMLTVLILGTFFSCDNLTKEKTEISKNDITLIDSAIVLSDSSVVTVFNNCLDNNISLKCLEKCGKGSYTQLKGNHSSPFNVKNTISGDTTKIEFYFVDDCGQNYVSHSIINGDTVYLKYESNSTVIIEAYCEYHYQFLLTNCQWTSIYLMGEKIFFYDLPSDHGQDTLSENIEPLQFVENMPEFVGGTDSLISFIHSTLIYPEWEKQNKIEGTIYISVIINKDGKVTSAEILRTVYASKNFDNEALRIINSMPTWRPGLHHGKKVSVRIILPVKFKL